MKINFKNIARYFFSGALFIVPLAVTIYFFVEVFAWLDGLPQVPYPGLGLLIVFGLITLVGYLASNFAFRTMLDTLDYLVNKIPFVKLIYSSVKDLIGAFVGDKKKFDKPVLVEINGENQLFQIGFITQANLSEIGLKDMVSVYIPHSYAISGMHYVVPRYKISPLNVTSAVAMKYIVSGGVSGFQKAD